MAAVGDAVVVQPTRAGSVARRGVIVKVVGGPPGHAYYLVAWTDDDSVELVPATARMCWAAGPIVP